MLGGVREEVEVAEVVVVLGLRWCGFGCVDVQWR